MAFPLCATSNRSRITVAHRRWINVSARNIIIGPRCRFTAGNRAPKRRLGPRQMATRLHKLGRKRRRRRPGGSGPAAASADGPCRWVAGRGASVRGQLPSWPHVRQEAPRCAPFLRRRPWPPETRARCPWCRCASVVCLFVCFFGDRP